MAWRTCYPEGKRKAVTFSYDDGRVYDRQLVEIFNQHGLKATFHLNSGKFGREDTVSAQEVATLYKGHEVACHGVTHAHFTHLGHEQLVREVWEDRRALEALLRQPVTGLSYPFGEYSQHVGQALETMGIEYARTVQATGQMRLPEDFLFWHPSCHHSEARPLVDKFLDLPPHRHLPLLYIWGHSYEFGDRNDWQAIQTLAESLGNRQGVWYATNIEIKRYVTAARKLTSSANGTVVYNPCGVAVWLETDGGIQCIEPGQTCIVQ